MSALLIDGEYYRKLYGIEKLQEIIEHFIGIVNYPNKVIYFSAMVESIKEKLNEIKNLEVNNEGYISTYDNGKKVQKGVDGYIVKELILLSQNPNIKDIYLIAGDGDLIAGIEYAKNCGKNLKVISCKDNTSNRIEKLVDVYNFSDYLKEDNDISEDNIFCLLKMWEKEKNESGWLSSTKIGQMKKQYNFNYSKNKLSILLAQLEEKEIIESQKELVGPGIEIRFTNQDSIGEGGERK